MDELELQDTPENDVETVEQDPAAEGQTDPEPAKPEEPYLAVNERTVYKTKDEAIRGYNEAASRIAALSAWEKQAKQYGLNDPKQLDAVAQELLELRKKVADAAKQASAPKPDPADPKAKETEQVRKYLRDNGFITKEEQAEALKALQERLDKFEQSGKQSEELRFQNQEAEARNDLNGYLTAAGVKDDANGSKAQIVGTLVKDWINSSEERIEQWTRGGVSAKNLVKEGTETMIKMLGWKAPVTPAAGQLKPTDPGYAAAKAKAVATNKKLPAPGTGRAHGDGSKPKVQKGHINTDLHEKAWKIFQESGAAD